MRNSIEQSLNLNNKPVGPDPIMRISTLWVDIIQTITDFCSSLLRACFFQKKSTAMDKVTDINPFVTFVLKFFSKIMEQFFSR